MSELGLVARRGVRRGEVKLSSWIAPAVYNRVQIDCRILDPGVHSRSIEIVLLISKEQSASVYLTSKVTPFRPSLAVERACTRTLGSPSHPASSSYYYYPERTACFFRSYSEDSTPQELASRRDGCSRIRSDSHSRPKKPSVLTQGRCRWTRLDMRQSFCTR